MTVDDRDILERQGLAAGDRAVRVRGRQEAHHREQVRPRREEGRRVLDRKGPSCGEISENGPVRFSLRFWTAGVCGYAVNTVHRDVGKELDQRRGGVHYDGQDH